MGRAWRLISDSRLAGRGCRVDVACMAWRLRRASAWVRALFVTISKSLYSDSTQSALSSIKPCSSSAARYKGLFRFLDFDGSGRSRSVPSNAVTLSLTSLHSFVLRYRGRKSNLADSHYSCTEGRREPMTENVDPVPIFEHALDSDGQIHMNILLMH